MLSFIFTLSLVIFTNSRPETVGLKLLAVLYCKWRCINIKTPFDTENPEKSLYLIRECFLYLWSKEQTPLMFPEENIDASKDVFHKQIYFIFRKSLQCKDGSREHQTEVYVTGVPTFWWGLPHCAILTAFVWVKLNVLVMFFEMFSHNICIFTTLPDQFNTPLIRNKRLEKVSKCHVAASDQKRPSLFCRLVRVYYKKIAFCFYSYRLSQNLSIAEITD